MKNSITKLLALVLVFVLSFSFVGCSLIFPSTGNQGGNGGETPDNGGETPDNGGETPDDGGETPDDGGEKPDQGGNEPADLPDDLKGITEDTIWVGNTAGTTGALSAIGAPFNLGIQAAFAAYNKAGGYNGKKIALKHYDDGGIADNSISMLDTLLYEDEVFAIVGHFGSYAVDVTLETLKDEKVPMIYAAAGNNVLFNENATSAEDKCIFPVQPLNGTEGRMLILRAFAPADKGGLAATKVGVISNSNEASQALLAGIKAEATESKLTNIVYQDISTSDYTSAINNLKAAKCDVVILTVIGADFVTCLTNMADALYYCKVLTSYNNASTAVFNDATDKNMTMLPAYEKIFSTMAIYSQAWLDITSATNVYKDDSSALYNAYKAAYLVYQKDAEGKLAFDENGQLIEIGMPGFGEEYWVAANAIYDYALTVDPTTAFAMSYDAYALAGYIAGDIFCQAMEALEKSGKALSRANLVEVMESQEFNVAMADKISFANGLRAGVGSFALTMFYDAFLYNGGTLHSASSVTVHTLTSIEDYRELLAGK